MEKNEKTFCALRSFPQPHLFIAPLCSHTMLRGQATTEQVLILAIALIIALVVVLMLGGNPTTSDIDLSLSKNYWNTANPIGIMDTFQEKGGDNLIIKITNKGTEPISVQYFDITNGGRTNRTFFGDNLTLGGGESRIITVKTPILPSDIAQYKVKIGYTSGGIDYQFRGITPLDVLQAPAVCMANAGKACGGTSDCCPGGGLSCQSGVCASCDAGGSLCTSSASCCTGTCSPVFGYSACCIATGQVCQSGGFPPPVPCCSGSCSAGVCN
jgi:hypothetical protein